MKDDKIIHISDELFKTEQFDVGDLQDEIRVDDLCGRLLRFFYLHLVEEEKRSPNEAGTLAHGADYFMREFIVPDRRENIFAISPFRVRQFAATWYIIRTVEPNMLELTRILHGVEAFYRYCQRLGRISAAQLAGIEQECHNLPYYGERIDRFWAIEGDGYFAWEEEVSLKN
ncbi:MAG: hypothetical protein IH614_03800 [Desulfuromonadales bacterium]|nr:hypothetical protein [Desulfuromonadales bacterium]